LRQAKMQGRHSLAQRYLETESAFALFHAVAKLDAEKSGRDYHDKPKLRERVRSPRLLHGQGSRHSDRNPSTRSNAYSRADRESTHICWRQESDLFARPTGVLQGL